MSGPVTHGLPVSFNPACVCRRHLQPVVVAFLGLALGGLTQQADAF